MQARDVLEEIWVRPFKTHSGKTTPANWMKVAVTVYTSMQLSLTGATDLHEWCWTTLHDLVTEDFLPRMLGVGTQDEDCPPHLLHENDLEDISRFHEEQAHEYIKRFLGPLVHLFQWHQGRKEALRQSVMRLSMQSLRKGRRWTCLHAWIAVQRWGNSWFREPLLTYDINAFLLEESMYKEWVKSSKSLENGFRGPTTSKTS